MMSDVGLRVVGVNEDFAGLATMMLRGLMAGSNRCSLQNLCLPLLVTIDLVEHAV